MKDEAGGVLNEYLMRLHSKEHKDVTFLLEKYGLGPEVLLTKKKGWIHIRLGERVFSYHRKKITEIIDGRFQDHYRYFVEVDKQKSELPDWDSVRRTLSEWLSSR